MILAAGPAKAAVSTAGGAVAFQIKETWDHCSGAWRCRGDIGQPTPPRVSIWALQV